MIWFASVHDFLTMNGYAAYVWPAWGMTTLAMAALVVHARRERRHLIANIARERRRQALLNAQGEGRT